MIEVKSANIHFQTDVRGIVDLARKLISPPKEKARLRVGDVFESRVFTHGVSVEVLETDDRGDPSLWEIRIGMRESY